MIPYGRQDISQADIDAIIAVLRSDFLTQGPAVPRFEESLADYCGVKHAVAVNSATSALHIACMALELGPGDRLWTSPNTFVASANCALYCGAMVDFVDIDPRTYNMSLDALQLKLEQADSQGRLPKVVIPVHFAGQSCDMAAIHSLAQQYDFRVIEDASHAIGGKYKDEPIGNCRYSDITVFSFHPVKIITTGEGGMALTNARAVADRMRLLRSHGITRAEPEMTKAPDGPWYYEQVALGFNYRMTDIQAALGESQLRRLPEFIRRRCAIAKRYRKILSSIPAALPATEADDRSAWHLFVIRVDKHRRKAIFEALRRDGIHANVHYIPIHLQPYYRRFGFVEGQYPEAERYYSEAITLPLFPGLSESEQDRIAATLRTAIGGAQ